MTNDMAIDLMTFGKENTWLGCHWTGISPVWFHPRGVVFFDVFHGRREVFEGDGPITRHPGMSIVEVRPTADVIKLFFVVVVTDGRTSSLSMTSPYLSILD